MLWIAAHTGITGNKLADQCAKEPANEAVCQLFVSELEEGHANQSSHANHSNQSNHES